MDGPIETDRIYLLEALLLYVRRGLRGRACVTMFMCVARRRLYGGMYLQVHCGRGFGDDR